MSIRNIAIIAHVDHGKTTLVDQILRQCKVFRDNQTVQTCILDSGDLERERGITITAKNISVMWNDTRINIIDTPGHADFGGEVERVLKMADGVLLLVDAFEGTMPQTRFVLQKALQLHLKPLVVINKVDRDNARPLEVVDEVFELFVDLNASEEQLDFPVLFAAGRDGWAIRKLGDERKNLAPLLEAILEFVPEPQFVDGPLQMLVTSLDYSDYVGRIGIGRIFRGRIREKDPVVMIKRDGRLVNSEVRQLFIFRDLGRTQTTEVETGDICAVVGMEGVDIGDTIAARECPEPLPIIAMDEPTITMNFMVNDSPFYGQEGKLVTSRQVRDRLRKECERDMALRVEDGASADTFKVSGRGILHLSILMETMRREGYEFMVGQPRVIYREIDGRKAEPVEVLQVEVLTEHAGKVIEYVGTRRGEMTNMEQGSTHTRLEFHMPSRGLIGFRNRMLRATSGEVVINHRFLQYEFFKGSIPERMTGSIVSMSTGDAIPYAIDALQDRGKFFIDPGEKVYTGQVIGENSKEGDLVVNVQKAKKLTNMRASGSDRSMKIAPAIKMSLEEAIEYLNNDEYLEVTPLNIRIRKSYLDENERKKRNKEALA
jgi:GTP-binding protein